MSDKPAPVARHRSPFAGHKPGEQLSASRQIGVRVFANTLPGVALISTWPAAMAAMRRALCAALNVDAVPGRTGLVADVDAGRLMCTGPQEFLLVGSIDADLPGLLRAHVTSETGSVVDLGHARCLIRVEGAHCRDTLSKLFALDLRAGAWPVGEMRLSGHHHVPCMLHRRAPDGFDLLVFSTYAYDQLASVLDAAREYGVSLTLGQPS